MPLVYLGTPNYDDNDDYFLALRDFFVGGGCSAVSWSAASVARESLALLAAALPLPLAAAVRPAGFAGAFAFEDLAAGWNSEVQR